MAALAASWEKLGRVFLWLGIWEGSFRIFVCFLPAQTSPCHQLFANLPPGPGLVPRASGFPFLPFASGESVGFAFRALAEGRLIMTGLFAPPEQRDGDLWGF